MFSLKGYDFDWQDYNSNLYVGNDKFVKSITQRIDTNEQPISLIGPPGCGKTWTLKAQQDSWENGHLSRLVFWVYLPELINVTEEQNMNAILNEATVSSWLEEQRIKALKHCPDIESFRDPTAAVQANIQTFVTKLCNECTLEKLPVLIVDGFDEISQIQQETIEAQFLDHFAIQACMRFIIPYRENTREPRIRNRKTYSIRLPGWQEIVFEQFACFVRFRYGQDTGNYDLKSWLEQLSIYKWNQPYINAFLFDAALKNNPAQLRLLTQNDLGACCLAVLQRPDQNGKIRCEVNKSDMDFLSKIACRLDETWISEDFEDAFDPIKIWDPRFVKWAEQGAIIQIKDQYTKYSLALGLRELLLEICNQEA